MRAYQKRPVICVEGTLSKQCKSCQRVLPLDNFYSKFTICKECCKRKRQLNGRQRWLDLEKNYGLLEQQFLTLWNHQNGKCKICRNDFENHSKACVDHNHKTHQIRGLLCNDCNLILGYSKESVQTLCAAIKYLENANEIP